MTYWIDALDFDIELEDPLQRPGSLGVARIGGNFPAALGSERSSAPRVLASASPTPEFKGRGDGWDWQ